MEATESLPAAEPAGPQFLAGRTVAEVGGSLALRYAGWLLADLGAEVQVLKPESQAPARPAEETMDRYLDLGKVRVESLDRAPRVALVDIGDAESRERGSASAAEWREAGTAVVEISHVNGDPRTPFGDLDANARSGVCWVIGEQEREPLALPYDIASFCAGTNAAAIAAMEMIGDGRGSGRRVQVTSAEVLAWYVAMNSLGDRAGVPWHREGRRAAGSGGLYPYSIFDCADGEVAIITRTSKEWASLLEALGSPEWGDDPRFRDQRAMAREYPDAADALLEPLLRRHTAAELVDMGIRFGFAVAPVNGIAQVLEEPHFRERAALRPLPGSEEIVVPAAPYRFRVAETVRAPEAAPGSPPAPAPASTPAAGRWRSAQLAGTKPLRGLKVLDLGWVWAAPMLTSVLADLGADVIKLEHGAKPDSLRLMGRIRVGGKPVDGPRIELGPTFMSVNRGKRSLALDLATPAGMEVLAELVAETDLVVENMRSGVLARLGMSFERMLELNPSVIYLAMTGGGQSGPLADIRAYAPIMSCTAGVDSLIGYPGEAPIGMMTMGLGDPNGAMHGLCAVFAALAGRERDGRGVFIDLSQIEALLPLVSEALIEHQLGEEVKPRGNSHPGMSPRGIYPTSRDEEWIAITAPDDAAWRRLRWTMRVSNSVRPERARVDLGWCEDPRLDSAAERERERGSLDRGMAEWTAGYTREHLLALLAQNRVPASPVNNHLDLDRDPTLNDGEFWGNITHPLAGSTPFAKVPWRSGELDLEPASPAPLLGQHSIELLSEHGIGDSRIDALVREEVIA